MHGPNVRNPAQGDSALCEEVWLLGQPPLSDYLDFMDEMAIGSKPTRAEIVDEWRTANDYLGELEVSEAGIADAVKIKRLPKRLDPLADAVRADCRFQRTFDTLPTRFAMVELDRLIVGHPYVSRHHCSRIRDTLGSRPSPETLFRFCIPLDREEAPVSVRKTGPGTYLFWSASSDFRHQESRLFNPDQLVGHVPMGAVGGIVGVLVGYGSNFLNVIQYGKRLLLHNGHHRAYALREMGITQAPCLVQTATRRDELEAVAARRVYEDPGFYFAAKRPPLLKDFFDPRIRKVVPVLPMSNIVEVRVEVRELKKTASLGTVA